MFPPLFGGEGGFLIVSRHHVYLFQNVKELLNGIQTENRSPGIERWTLHMCIYAVLETTFDQHLF